MVYILIDKLTYMDTKALSIEFGFNSFSYANMPKKLI